MKKGTYIYCLIGKYIFLWIGVSLIQITSMKAQEVFEYAPPEHIKSIQFYGAENTENFPLVALGEKINLLFVIDYIGRICCNRC